MSFKTNRFRTASRTRGSHHGRQRTLAKERGEDRIYGHQHGVDSVRECTEAVEIGVKHLTIMLFLPRTGTDRKKKWNY